MPNPSFDLDDILARAKARIASGVVGYALVTHVRDCQCCGSRTPEAIAQPMAIIEDGSLRALEALPAGCEPESRTLLRRYVKCPSCGGKAPLREQVAQALAATQSEFELAARLRHLLAGWKTKPEVEKS